MVVYALVPVFKKTRFGGFWVSKTEEEPMSLDYMCGLVDNIDIAYRLRKAVYAEGDLSSVVSRILIVPVDRPSPLPEFLTDPQSGSRFRKNVYYLEGTCNVGQYVAPLTPDPSA